MINEINRAILNAITTQPVKLALEIYDPSRDFPIKVADYERYPSPRLITRHL